MPSTRRTARNPGTAGPSPFTLIPLQCLRCGDLAVPVAPLFVVMDRGRLTVSCRFCDAEHYLAIREERDGFFVSYQRYTNRHPLEDYDEYDASDPPVVRFKVLGGSGGGADDGFSGPIAIYPRRQCSRPEVSAIWRATKGRCHICGRSWRLNQRGARGWHIDHVIPHSGGGSDVEELPNLRVACAVCNLRKGKGYTQASVWLSIRPLIETIKSTVHPAARTSRLMRGTSRESAHAASGGAGAARRR